MRNLTNILNNLSNEGGDEVPCRCPSYDDPEWGSPIIGQIERRCHNQTSGRGDVYYTKTSSNCNGKDGKCKGSCKWAAKCYRSDSFGNVIIGPPEERAPPVFMEYFSLSCIVL